MTPVVLLVCRFCGEQNLPTRPPAVERLQDGTIFCQTCGKSAKESA